MLAVTTDTHRQVLAQSEAALLASEVEGPVARATASGKCCFGAVEVNSIPPGFCEPDPVPGDYKRKIKQVSQEQSRNTQQWREGGNGR